MIDKTNKFYSLYFHSAKEDGSFFAGMCFPFPVSNPIEFGICADFDWESNDGNGAYGPYYFYVEWLGTPRFKTHKTWTLTLPKWLAKRLP